MKDLPSGWAVATLGDMAKYVNGKAFKAREWKTDGLPIIRIQNLNNPNALFNYTNVPHEEQYFVQDGDLLVAWAASLGAYKWKGGDAWVNQHIFRVEPVYNLVEKQYLYYTLKNAIEELYKKTRGSGIIHVTKGTFEEHRVPLAPLNEQKRIADKLDRLLARVQSCRENLIALTKLIESLQIAVIDNAYEGLAKNSDWSEAELSFLCESITDGDHQAPPRSESGVPFITISAIKNGNIDMSRATRYVPETYFEQIKESRKPRARDVLYSVTGTIGIPALVKTNQRFTFQRHIAILRPKSDLLSSEFLWLMLKSGPIRRQAASGATGTAQLTIPISVVRGLRIPHNSLSEQDSVVRIIHERSRQLNSVAEKLTTSYEKVNLLTSKILSMAFNGELVHQDPNDEPATHLLKRIRAEREQAKATSLKRKNKELASLKATAANSDIQQLLKSLSAIHFPHGVEVIRQMISDIAMPANLNELAKLAIPNARTMLHEELLAQVKKDAAVAIQLSNIATQSLYQTQVSTLIGNFVSLGKELESAKSALASDSLKLLRDHHVGLNQELFETISKLTEFEIANRSHDNIMKPKPQDSVSRHDDDVKGKAYLANLLRELGGVNEVKTLFEHSGLSLADFYLQLSFETDEGWIKDRNGDLEAS